MAEGATGATLEKAMAQHRIAHLAFCSFLDGDLDKEGLLEVVDRERVKYIVRTVGGARVPFLNSHRSPSS